MEDALTVVDPTKLTVSCRRSIGDAYHVLTFDAPFEVQALPGQFMMVSECAWDSPDARPTPMSYLGAGATPSILVKVVGPGTARLAAAEPGDAVWMQGPLGRPWRLPEAGRAPLLVAGGAGVAPVLFLARRLHACGYRPLGAYGGRTAGELPLRSEFEDVCQLKIATEDGSLGIRGRVTDLLEDLIASNVGVYVCGPRPLTELVGEMCANRGVPCQMPREV